MNTPTPVRTEPEQPAAAGGELPKAKQTTLGLYVTAAEAYQMWKAAPDTVKVIDVRTPEEFAFVGHPKMAWNVPVSIRRPTRSKGLDTAAYSIQGSRYGLGGDMRWWAACGDFRKVQSSAAAKSYSTYAGR